MFATLVDYVTGRSSAWRAKNSAALIALTNPDTGVPYDATNPLPVGATVVMPAGLATAALQTTGNTSLASIDGKTPALSGGAVPVTGPLTDTQLRAAAVPISATALPLPTGAATETTLSALNTKIPAQATPGLLPVDTLGTPGTPRVQATSGAAASIVLTTTCRRLSMYATTGTWYSISGTASATSHYIATGERLDIDVPASTTISVLQETTAGSIRITELV